MFHEPIVNSRLDAKLFADVGYYYNIHARTRPVIRRGKRHAINMRSHSCKVLTRRVVCAAAAPRAKNSSPKSFQSKGSVLPSPKAAKERNSFVDHNLTRGEPDPKRKTCLFNFPAHRVTKASRCMTRFSFPSCNGGTIPTDGWRR
jgi:hypothetical protein